VLGLHSLEQQTLALDPALTQKPLVHSLGSEQGTPSPFFCWQLVPLQKKPARQSVWVAQSVLQAEPVHAYVVHARSSTPHRPVPSHAKRAVSECVLQNAVPHETEASGYAHAR
jgi:hypothetical protein